MAVIAYVIPLSARAESLTVTYGLYAGGFNVVEIEGVYDIGDDSYDLQMDLKTAGLLGKLAPWSGVLQTRGVVDGAKPTPLFHSFASTWRQETETSTFDFSKSGVLQAHKKIENDGSVADKMPPEDVYQGGAVDILTGLFRAMRGQECAGLQDVLDGKRRFDMVFRSKGIDMIRQSRYTVFDGQAERCEVEIVPTAGKWRDKPRGWMSIQEQAKGNGMLPQIWFGKLRDDLPPVPVKFLIKTNYGTMVMHLQSVR